ncbi:unnamed protein product [Urochloa humidicola]
MEELMRMQTQLMQTMAQSIAMMQQNQQNQALVRDKRAEFMKGHPPKFSHTSNPLQADDWLKAVERQLNIAQCTDREKFRDSFHSHHVPVGLMELKMKEFRNLKEEGMSVTSYRDKFLELARYAPKDVSTDRKRHTCFRAVLQDAIQLEMMCITFPNFGELVDGALKIEHKRLEMEDKKRKFMSQQSRSNARPRFNFQPSN